MLKEISLLINVVLLASGMSSGSQLPLLVDIAFSGCSKLVTYRNIVVWKRDDFLGETLGVVKDDLSDLFLNISCTIKDNFQKALA